MDKSEKKQRMKRGTNPNSLANLKKFEKGKSGNPNGCPVGVKQRGTILEKWLVVETESENPLTLETQSLSVEDQIILALIKKAKDGDVRAIQEIQDTVYGKLTDKSELNLQGSVDLKLQDAINSVYDEEK